MTAVASVHGVLIRLTAERWGHIVENHDVLAGRQDDVLDTVACPHRVIEGYRGTLIAVRKVGKSR